MCDASETVTTSQTGTS